MRLLDDPIDDRMISVMTDLWANFAIHGHPTPREGNNKQSFIGKSLSALNTAWESVQNPKEPNYVILKDGRIHFEKDEDAERRLKVWREEFHPNVSF